MGRLPLEVLTFIFAIAVTSDRTARAMSHPKPRSVDFANVLVSVCSHWRRVAIGIPELWSYIDLSGRGELDHATLWLERARNRALDIRTGSETAYPDWRHQHIPLLQNASRARSLLLRGDRDYMYKWFSEWYQKGIPGATITLALYPALEDGDELEFPGPYTILQTRLNDLLNSIRVLYLRAAVVTWDRISFQNLSILCLVELEEVESETAMTMDILCEMLLASPRLRCLQLARIYLHRPGSVRGRQNAPLIHLEHLETLELSNLRDVDAFRMLSIITPGSRSLNFLISCADQHSNLGDIAEGVLVSFFQRSNVTAFYCGANTVESLSPAIVYALPSIEVLCLASKTIGAEFSNSVAPDNATFDSVQTHWPKLHTFEAAGCEFEDITDFKRLLAACPIRELRIDGGCSTSVSIGDPRNHGSMAFENWAGPGVAFSDDCRKWEIGYTPFQ